MRQQAIVITLASSARVEYLHYTLACLRSIQDTGAEDDIVVTVQDVSEDHRERLRDAGAIVIETEKLNRKGNDLVSNFDLQKLQLWTLPYQRVLAVDPDCLFTRRFKNWGLKELTTLVGTRSPLCSAVMFLRPSPKTHRDMMICLDRWTFDKKSGWNDHGQINWDFNGAGGAQGFLYYYFRILRKFYRFGFTGINHYGGEKTLEYLEYLDRVAHK